MAKRKAKLEYLVIMGDVHAPFHNQKHVNAVLSLVKDLKPVRVAINGDLIDCYTVSKYDKSPNRKITFWDEVDSAKNLLLEVRKAAGIAPIDYIEGNHEIRLRAYIANNAPQLSSIPTLTLETLLALKELGISYIKARNRGAFTRYDNVVVGHFDRVTKNSGQTAKMLVDDHMTSIVQGHTHRLGSFYKSTIGGDFIGVEGGCLCELNPDYLDTANWQAGCVVLAREEGDAEWRIIEVPIIDGKIYFNGNIYE